MAAGTEEEREYICGVLEDRLYPTDYMHSTLHELLVHYSAPTPAALLPSASTPEASIEAVTMSAPPASRSKQGPKPSPRNRRCQATSAYRLPMSRAERTMRESGYTLDDVREQIHEHAHTLIKALDLSESDSDEAEEDEDSTDGDTFEKRYMDQIEQMPTRKRTSPEVALTRTMEKPPELVNLDEVEDSLEEANTGEDVQRKDSKETGEGKAGVQGVPFGTLRVTAGDKVLTTSTLFTNSETANRLGSFQRTEAINQRRVPHRDEGMDRGKGLDKKSGSDKGKSIGKGKGIDKGKAPAKGKLTHQVKSIGKGDTIDTGDSIERWRSIVAGESLNDAENLVKSYIAEYMDKVETSEVLRKDAVSEDFAGEASLSKEYNIAESFDTDAESEDDEGENFLTDLCIRRGYTNKDHIVAAVLWGLEDWPRYEILMETEEHETIADAYLSLLHMLSIQVRGLTEDLSPVEKYSKPDEAYKHSFLGRYSTG